MMGAHKIELRKARRALSELLRDPEQTERVFEIGDALAGRQSERMLARVKRSPDGERLLRERPLLTRETCELGDLLRLPHGTFGYEYACWMRDNDFTPGLMERTPRTDDPNLAYLARRSTQVHDFWHVLSGYNRDPIGELGVLAFTYGQAHPRGIGFILLGVVARSIRESLRSRGVPFTPLIPYLWRAYRRGRRASFLTPLVLEDYFSLPLDSVRQTLGIEPLETGFNEQTLPPIFAPQSTF
jgi:ubiquinone biosynthesis protein COQ4